VKFGWLQRPLSIRRVLNQAEDWDSSKLEQETGATISKFNWPWWIRTTINGSKVRCPAIGRRASNRWARAAGLKPSGPGAVAKGGLALPHFEPKIQ
jgi:hypothetical protein